MLRTSVPGAILKFTLSLLHQLTPILLPLSLATLPTKNPEAIIVFERLGTLTFTAIAWIGATFCLSKFTETLQHSKRSRANTLWLLSFVALSALSLAFIWAFRSRSTELMLTLLLIAIGAHALAKSDKLSTLKGVLRVIEGALLCIVTWWSIGATLDWQHAAICIVAAMLLSTPDFALEGNKAPRFFLLLLSAPAIVIGILSLIGELPPPYLLVYGVLPFCARYTEARSISVFTLLLCFIASTLTS